MIYFLLGMLCYGVAIPIIESLTALIATLIEVPKGLLSCKIAKINKQLTRISEEDEVAPHVIGFQIPSGEDDYYEEEEDD